MMLGKVLVLVSLLMSTSTMQAAEEKEDPSSRPYPGAVLTHAQPYDITPYQDKTLPELGGLLVPHQNLHQEGVREILPLTLEIDEGWKTFCDIWQAAIQKEPTVSQEFDNYFGMKRAELRLFKYTSGSRLFYMWKQAAWVNPDDAETLVHVLTNGFQDKIPIQLEWVPYWRERAQLLRSSPSWYIPKDSGSLPIPEGADVLMKLRILLRMERYL